MRSLAILSMMILSRSSINGVLAQPAPTTSAAPSLSGSPSEKPSGSSRPTASDAPSIAVSGSPSSQPSTSDAPSGAASGSPSSEPSKSAAPTALASSHPTQNPTAVSRPNDVCVDALITPPDGVHREVDLSTATPDPTANGGACDGVTIGETNGSWFAVEGTGQTLRASTCHPDTQIKVKITLFATLDSSCNTLQCRGVSFEPDYGCSMTTLTSRTTEDMQWSSPSTKVDFPTISGLKYYLLVQQNSIVETGKVHLSIRPVTSPEHDDCVDAFGPMPRNGLMVEQSTLDASFSQVFTGFCNQPSRYPGVWYQFMGNGGNVDLSACAYNNFDGFHFSVYEGKDCDDLTCVANVQTYAVEDDAECFFRTSLESDATVTGVQRSRFQAIVPTTEGRRYYVYLHYAKTTQDTVTTEKLRFSVKDADGAPVREEIKFLDSVYGMGPYVPGNANRKTFLEDSAHRKTPGSGASEREDKRLRTRAAAVASLASLALAFAMY